jgi:hypothetical protein
VPYSKDANDLPSLLKDAPEIFKIQTCSDLFNGGNFEFLPLACYSS